MLRRDVSYSGHIFTMQKILSVLAVAAFCLGTCGARVGVESTDEFLKKNFAYLRETVDRFKTSALLRVQLRDYAAADKYGSSKDDAAFYEELRRFMDETGVISITNVKRLDGEQRIFEGVSFHVREYLQDGKLIFEYIAFVEPGANPVNFYDNGSCKVLEISQWYICTSMPLANSGTKT
jgi:hypothetical protein